MNSPSYDQADQPLTSNDLTSASRRIREASRKDASSVAGSVAASAAGSAAVVAKDPEYIPLHELAKGWKAAISWATDPVTKGEARKKNDRGNLPLHSAASFRAPVEVIGESFLCWVLIFCVCLFACAVAVVVACVCLRQLRSFYAGFL